MSTARCPTTTRPSPSSRGRQVLALAVTGIRRRRRALAGWAGLAGACCYSWYLAAPLTGTRLDPTRAYVSELVVPGSPGSAWFRIADITAGALIIVLAAGLWKRTDNPARRDTLGALAVAVIGATATVDGLDPMTCAPSVDPACRLAEQSQPLLGQLTDLHTASGVIGVVAALVAMASLGYRPTREPAGGRLWWLGPVCAGAVLSLGGVLSALALADGPGVGVVEHVQLLLIAGWLTAMSTTLIRAGVQKSLVTATT